MTLTSALVLLATLSPGIPSTPVDAPDLLQVIDARYQRGEIDLERLHTLRVAAIRQPDQLPDDLRALGGRVVGHRATAVLVEGMQHVIRTQTQGSALHALLQPPADLALHLDSTLHPIRVSYRTAGQLEYAQAVLAAAELAWDVQIGEFGFAEPVIQQGYSPYRFYIDTTDPGVAGYTAPYEVDPNSTYPRCFTYIFISPNLGLDYVGSTVVHEANHSMQASMDCLEITAFWEHTATYIEGRTYAPWDADTYWFFPYFQAEPWRPLDYFASGAGYPYGASLWLHYLASRIAPTDGGVMAAELWTASRQPSLQNNEPDYLDAINTVAQARGGDATDLETLYVGFAEARYFISSNDDGQHLAFAGDLPDAELAVTDTLAFDDLPVVEQEPPVEQRPAPFGMNAIEVRLSGETRPLIFGFEGGPGPRWSARVARVGASQTTVVDEIPLDPTTGMGTLVVDPASYDKLVLLVVNLGNGSYDPDDQAWGGSPYYYRIEPVVDPPVVTAVYPAAVRRGQQNLHLRVVGQGFVYGREFAVQFGAAALDVVSIDTMSATEISLTLTVPASTELGPTAITVTNAGGQATTEDGLLTIVAAFDSLVPPERPEDEGGCQTGGTPGPAALPLVILALIWIRRRR
jgi:uncharacterized protein (TIGR03382 family)